MVTRSRHVWQGGDGPAALPGWGHPDIPSLTAGDMRALLASTKSRKTARLVYALFVVHADAMGFVQAKIEEVAKVAGLPPETARHSIRDLVESGDLVRVRRGTHANPSIWRITAVANVAA